MKIKGLTKNIILRIYFKPASNTTHCINLNIVQYLNTKPSDISVSSIQIQT